MLIMYTNTHTNPVTLTTKTPHLIRTIVMAEVNDPTQYGKKYRSAIERLETSDIDDNDQEAILDHVMKRKVSGKYKASTLTKDAVLLKRASEIYDKPLVAWDFTDYVRFMDGVQDGTAPNIPTRFEGKGYSDEYCRGFRQILRVFFRDREALGTETDYSWFEEIEIGQPNRTGIQESDCFTSDETARMFDECTNSRDRALLALMLATGQRASAMLSFRVGDVDIPPGDRAGRIHLNPEAIGLKGAEGFRPMIWSTPYVAAWLNDHPNRDDDDSALFVSINTAGTYERGDPLSYDGLRAVIERLGEKAGIDESKLNAHRFRHTAIRRMIRDNLNEQKIKHMVGWGEDSPQFQRYGSLMDEQHADDIEDHYGYERGETDETGKQFDNCPRCNIPLTELASPSFCPDCGLPLMHDAEEIADTMDETVTRDMAETDHPENLMEMKKLLDDNPELLNQLETLKELTD